MQCPTFVSVLNLNVEWEGFGIGIDLLTTTYQHTYIIFYKNRVALILPINVCYYLELNIY